MSEIIRPGKDFFSVPKKVDEDSNSFERCISLDGIVSSNRIILELLRQRFEYPKSRFDQLAKEINKLQDLLRESDKGKIRKHVGKQSFINGKTRDGEYFISVNRRVAQEKSLTGTISSYVLKKRYQFPGEISFQKPKFVGLGVEYFWNELKPDEETLTILFHQLNNKSMKLDVPFIDPITSGDVFDCLLLKPEANIISLG